MAWQELIAAKVLQDLERSAPPREPPHLWKQNRISGNLFAHFAAKAGQATHQQWNGELTTKEN